MKYISLEIISQAFLTVIYRFTYVLLFAMIATISAVGLVWYNFEQLFLLKIFQTSTLGGLLFLVIRLFLENISFQAKISRFLQTFGFIFLGVYFLSLGSHLHYSEYVRFMVLVFALHVLVSVAPYLSYYREQQGFWHYNMSIFLRFLRAFLYTGVLYLGLVIALVAVERLFDLPIHIFIYYSLGICILGIFHTSYFLAGIPQDFPYLDRKDDYPQELTFFTQFVLLPLVIIYLIILYVYGFKILIPWYLPKGSVAYLVIIFSIVGIFSLLLVHPIREEIGNRWIRIFSYVFYMALLPLIFLLLVSIRQRITDYGITELRYYVGLMMFWLLGTAIYFLTSRRKNIQFVPMSLAGLLILSSFGPWGAVAVARQSQLYRLQRILEHYQMLESNKIKPEKARKAKISQEDLKKTEGILQFLNQRGSLQRLQPYFDQNLDSLFVNTATPNAREEMLIHLIGNQALVHRLNLKNTRDQMNFSTDKSQKIHQIQGYDYMIRVEQYALANRPEMHLLDNQEIEINGDFEEGSLRILQKKSREVLLSFDLKITIQNLMRYHLKKSYDVPLSEMSLIEESLHYQAKLLLDHVGIIRITSSEFKLTGLSGTIFIKFNR